MENLTLCKKKLSAMILMMESERRTKRSQYCDWVRTCLSLWKQVFHLDVRPNDWPILEKGERLVCFTIIHEAGCKGQFFCPCKETLADPHIKVYYFSEIFSKMVSVSHFQLFFSGNFNPDVLADIIDELKVSSVILELFDSEEEETADLRGRDSEHGVADKKDIEKDQSHDFQRIRKEYNSLLCEYVKLAFTDPTSLPPFLLDVDEGPTMRLSQLPVWLKSE